MMRILSTLAVLGLTGFALAACDPQVVVDKTIARTAEAVVAPITGDGVARCVVENAQPVELEILARDVGVSAGTRTTAIIQGILARPATQACLQHAGLPAPTL
jgi:ABC-type amino acid transport substrate-binding protein